MNLGSRVRVGFFILLMTVIAPAAQAEAPSTVETLQRDEIRMELDSWRTFRRALKTADQPEAVIVAHWAAAVRCLFGRAQEVLGEPECTKVKKRLYRDEVRRLFLKKVVAPRVAPSDAEVATAVRQSLADSAKPESIQLLEIFVWAPKDLPELRHDKKLMLEKLAPQLGTAKDFRKTAEHSSEATSAFKGGSIGTVYKNQIPEALWTTLAETESGLTPILENPTGLFQFFVIGRRPARRVDPDTLTPRLRRRMISNRVGDSLASILRGFHREFGVKITIPPPSSPHEVAAIIAEHDYTLLDLDLSPSDENRASVKEADIRRAIDALVMRRAVEKAGVQVQVPHFREVVTLGKLVLERLVEAETRSPERIREVSRLAQKLKEAAAPRRIWSFEIVRISGVEGSERLFELFRIRHELGKTVTFENLASQIHESTGLEVSIESHTRVDDRKVAGLGPEIHQTLLLRSSEGELSRPLHLADLNEAVFVRLLATAEDSSGATEAALAAAKGRVQAEIVEELIGANARQCSDLTD